MMPQIGYNAELNFPQNVVLLADKIYPSRYPLVTPYTRRQLNLRPPHIQKECRKLNRLITHYIVKVEHAICDIERYRVIDTLWRHPRRKMKNIVELWCICETSTNSVLSLNIVQIFDFTHYLFKSWWLLFYDYLLNT